MTLRADSYGSVEAVRALTRHLLDGAATFSATTRPTLAEVEGMIDRWSTVLNVDLINREVTVPVAADSPARLVCDQWVIRQAAAEVELTQRGTGWNADEGSRIQALRMDTGEAVASSVAAALRKAGLLAHGNARDGLSFTGTSVAVFTRGQFDA